MKVLVTGASGFVGRSLCHLLNLRGDEVVRVNRYMSVMTDIAVGDIGPDTNWHSAFVTKPEAVVHLAARVHFMNEVIADPKMAYRQTNVEGTCNLARQAAAAGIKRFVYLSSIKVNGEICLPERPFKETDEPAPQDLYAASKYEAERELLKLAQNTRMEIVIIRPPLIYGPGVKGNFASLLNWITRGMPLPLGAVHNLRSLIALDNLVDFVTFCLDPKKSPNAANEVFLVSDAEDISTPELLLKIGRAYGKKVRLFSVPVSWLRLSGKLLGKEAVTDRLIGSLVVDSSKARNMLGWKPVVSTDEQLRRMAEHVTSA